MLIGETPQLWSELRNLGRHAELTLLRSAAGENPVIREATMHTLDLLRRDVAGAHPSVLERLLADRVAISWLSLSVAEGTYHQALERGLSQANDTFHQQRIERAQRRFLAAIKALAQVRKLGVPAVQVNIGEKQVNVAAGGRANRA
ncbi:MAG TPA: hypothetical protein VGW38_04355 [Chloroflexota bacterium]|nr:hypothetical protein [Chloroflexota bacterium]